MKGHKARKCRAEGGGAREWEEDLKDKPARYNEGKPEAEAEELKRGGKAKKAVAMTGKAKHHAGRKPRKAGGRTGADSHPFSSARTGTEPAGHKSDDIE